MNIKSVRTVRLLSKIVLALGVVFLFLWGGYFVIQSVMYRPFKVRISNVTSNSATVSWYTRSPMKGSVFYKESNTFLPFIFSSLGAQQAYDDRDVLNAQTECMNILNSKVKSNSNFTVNNSDIDCSNVKVRRVGNYYVHHVTIKNLNESKKYYFRVGDGLLSWNIGNVDQTVLETEYPAAQSFDFSTFEIPETVLKPNPSYGKVTGVLDLGKELVMEDDGVDALVFARLVSYEGNVQSELLTSVTNDFGGWYIDKSNARLEDGSTYAFEDDKDVMYVGTQYRSYKESKTSKLTLGFEDSPASEIIGVTEEELNQKDDSVLQKIKDIFVKDADAVCIDGVGCSTYAELMESRAKGGDGVSDSERRRAERYVNSHDMEKEKAAGMAALANQGSDVKTIKDKLDKGTALTKEESSFVMSNPNALGYGNSLKALKNSISSGGVSSADVQSWAKGAGFNSGAVSSIPDDGTASGGGSGVGTGTGSDGGNNTVPENTCDKISDAIARTQCNKDYYEKYPPKFELHDTTSAVLELSIQNNTCKSGSSTCDWDTVTVSFGGSDKPVPITSYIDKGALNTMKEENNWKEGAGTICLTTRTVPTDGCDITVKPVAVNFGAVLGNLSSVKDKADEKYREKLNTAIGMATLLTSEKSEAKNKTDIKNALNAIEDKMFGTEGSLEIDNDGNSVTVKKNSNGTYAVYGKDGKVEKVLEGFDKLWDYLHKKGLDEDVLAIKDADDGEDGDSKCPGGADCDKDNPWLVDYASGKYSTEIFCNFQQGCRCDYSKGDTDEGYKDIPRGATCPTSDQLANAVSTDGKLGGSDIGGGLCADFNGCTCTNHTIEFGDRCWFGKAGSTDLYPEDTPKDCGHEQCVCKYGGNRMYITKRGTSCLSKAQFEDSYRGNVSEANEPPAIKESMTDFSSSSGVCTDKDGCYCKYSSTHVLITVGQKCIEENNVGYYDGKKDDVVAGSTCNDPEGCKCGSFDIGFSAGCGSGYSPGKEDLNMKNTTTEKQCFFQGGCKCHYSNTGTPIEIGPGESCPAKDKIESSTLIDLFRELFVQLSIAQEDTENYEAVLGTTNEETADNSYFFLPEYGFYNLEFEGVDVGDKVEKGDNTLYLFYVEANGIDGFQAPKDIENPQVGEDLVIQSSAFEIKYSKTAEQKELNLVKGYNMISFDYLLKVADSGTTSAMDFVLWLRKNGRDVSSLSFFDNGKWNGGIICTGTEETSCSGKDFPLLPGKGYVVSSNEKVSTFVPGYNLESSVPVPLYEGWNFIGINGYNKVLTAKSFIVSANEIEGLTVDNVTKWDTSLGAYEGLQVSEGTEYGFDYQLLNNQGYFVRVEDIVDTTNCKAKIWHLDANLHGSCGSYKDL